MALVRVEHLGGRCAGDAAVGAQRAHAADAEQHLLLQAMLAAAAVQPVGDLALGGVVLLDVGVQQEQRDAAHLRDPDAGGDEAAAGQADGDLRGGPVGLAEERDGAAVGIGDRVPLLLPAVARERLLEVARAVEQPDRDDRHAEVARGLQVVAGEDAQAAGVLGQRGGDAVLGREVGDPGGRLGAQRLEPPVGREVAAQVVTGAVRPVDEALVGGQLREALGRHLAQQPDRVMAALVPQDRVDRREHVAGLRVPGPSQVDGELLEGGEVLGQHGTDGESSNGSHGAHASGSYPTGKPADPRFRHVIDGIFHATQVLSLASHDHPMRPSRRR